ncbi:NifB/NifX family molybdenum-iron cluster-binding protein [Hydrogenimonas thermophila]|jgi:predicted Fe-Mo cluster-binding NifX family protein|uniref:Predicted Fe-Mo cluster-binding protein, NifX family n=1 Tax=Hydrogenimonas thermophila TaxID=223786 RepID=A0A1I5T8N4_9BACT|nr:NifB/NifX family molybdenum-iron cluster-binding protein [Hydrogenimonas thermophila]WOE70223.1 NifB/NifX family molybdenum-iron cluster-binding protein [Hydrogenimonas thermophila]WOE72740.1 NifB/NifX family molybdenum-iron cluster-binding protein [Hydrogenimonas thermophila]SFP79400.1 Predicted Fe-Mo cluster-binding protein, NifX family [Hydrogenimonas thermophila]
MKIVFTAKGDSWDSPMDPRFGRMDTLLLFDEEKDELKAFSNNTEGMDHGAGLQTAKKVIELKPDVIITGNGAGEKALEILKKYDLKIYIGAGDLSVKEAYKAYKNGILERQL